MSSQTTKSYRGLLWTSFNECPYVWTMSQASTVEVPTSPYAINTPPRNDTSPRSEQEVVVSDAVVEEYEQRQNDYNDMIADQAVPRTLSEQIEVFTTENSEAVTEVTLPSCPRPGRRTITPYRRWFINNVKKAAKNMPSFARQHCIYFSEPDLFDSTSPEDLDRLEDAEYDYIKTQLNFLIHMKYPRKKRYRRYLRHKFNYFFVGYPTIINHFKYAFVSIGTEMSKYVYPQDVAQAVLNLSDKLCAQNWN